MTEVSQTIRPDHAQENILQLEDPTEARYHIERYTLGLRASTLRVRVQWHRQAIYLDFDHVRYIEGPLSRTGHNFRTLSEAECQDLLAKSDHDSEVHIPFCLYTFDTNTLPIKILASGEVRVYRLTQAYFQSQDEKLLERITTDPDTGELSIAKESVGKSGKRTFIYHHVADILSDFEAGNNHEQILLLRNSLESEDIQACLVYARQAISEKQP